MSTLSVKVPRPSGTTQLYRIQTFAVLYIGMWAISPPLAYGTIWRFLAVVAVVLWVLVEAMRPNGVIQKPSWSVLLAVTYVIYTLAIELLVPDITTITHFFQIWILLLFLVIAESNKRRGLGAFIPYFWLVMLLMPVWMTMTLIGYETVAQDASRTMSRSSDAAREMSALGIGGYGMIYSLVLIFPIVGYLAINWRFVEKRLPKSRKMLAMKWLIRLNAVMAMIVIFNAGYAIALIVSAIAILIILLLNSTVERVVLKSLALIVVAIISVAFFLYPTLEALERAASGTEYAQKINDIRFTLEFGDAAGTVESRWSRYLRSASLALENPFIGTLKFDNVGKHSSYLDHFAQYGFLIGWMFFILIVHWPYRLLRNRSVPASLGISTLFIAFALPLVNSIFAAFGLILFMFYPAAVALYQGQVRLKATRGHVGPSQNSVAFHNPSNT